MKKVDEVLVVNVVEEALDVKSNHGDNCFSGCG